MRADQINIRDPFVLAENGKYYLYGTRAADFGRKTGGFDVYVSVDLAEWSGPFACFDSERFGLNREVNWAPEVHCYQGSYYIPEIIISHHFRFYEDKWNPDRIWYQIHCYPEFLLW